MVFSLKSIGLFQPVDCLPRKHKTREKEKGRKRKKDKMSRNHILA
jgi:hypothetical protein